MLTAETLTFLQSWTGRQESARDQIDGARVAAMSATLDRDDPLPRQGAPLPQPWHWMFCVPAVRQSALGPDGHPARGGFLPPVPLPRRMWAGGRLTYTTQPLRVGDTVQRHSRVVSINHKHGRSGELVFVLVRHEFHGPQGLAVTEEHDIVYRSAPATGAAQVADSPAPATSSWQRTINPDDVLLFRYSALTFNGHRIHYDRRYVTQVEGYPGLIVHGPLQATLLLDLLRREKPDARVAGFTFKALKPVFDIAPFSVHGTPTDYGQSARLWVSDAAGALAMEAQATLMT